MLAVGDFMSSVIDEGGYGRFGAYSRVELERVEKITRHWDDMCWIAVNGRVGDWRGGVGCPVSSPLPSIRACGSPAHGLPTSFTVRHASCAR